MPQHTAADHEYLARQVSLLSERWQFPVDGRLERGRLDRRGSYDSAPGQMERMRWLRDHCSGSVLDIGCGIGKLAELLPEKVEYVGLDVRPDYVALCQLELAVQWRRFYCVDAQFGIPFPNDSFGTVVVAEVLEHLRFSVAHHLLRECLRVAPRVLTTLPGYTPGQPYCLANVESGEHLWIASPDLVTDLAARAGAKIITNDLICNGMFRVLEFAR